MCDFVAGQKINANFAATLHYIVIKERRCNLTSLQQRMLISFIAKAFAVLHLQESLKQLVHGGVAGFDHKNTGC